MRTEAVCPLCGKPKGYTLDITDFYEDAPELAIVDLDLCNNCTKKLVKEEKTLLIGVSKDKKWVEHFLVVKDVFVRDVLNVEFSDKEKTEYLANKIIPLPYKIFKKLLKMINSVSKKIPGKNFEDITVVKDTYIKR